jgi:hypothetical protein
MNNVFDFNTFAKLDSLGRLGRRVHTAPQVHRAQLLATASLQIHEELRAVSGTPGKNQIDDELATGVRACEHRDRRAKAVVADAADELCVDVSLRRNRRDDLVEIQAVSGVSAVTTRPIVWPTQQ